LAPERRLFVDGCSLRNFVTTNNQQLSGGLQGDDRDFGGAVEAEGQTYRANAAVDVELHLVEAVVTLGVLQTHGRQDERAQEGKPDLTTVGVTGEHEVDEMAARMLDDVVSEVGLVRHEKDWTVGFGRNGEIEVRVAGAGIFDSAEPEACAVALDGDVLVDENGSAVGGEGFGDHWAVESDVVVTEDGVATRCGEGGKNLGTAMDGVFAGDEGEGAAGNEVPGKQDEVGGEAVDLVDDVLEEERFGVLVEVNVANLGDAIAVEGSRQVRDGDGSLNDVDLVARDFAGVESKSGCGCSCPYEEIAAGEA